MKEHIFFRRIVKHCFKIILNTLMIYLVFWLLTPIRNSILIVLSAIPGMEAAVLLLFSAAGGAFLAADEAVKLSDDADNRVHFLRETPQNTFRFLPECKLIFRSDIYRNDVFCVFLMQLVNLGILKVVTWVKVMLDGDLIEREQDIRYLFLSHTYNIMFFLIISAYILFHVLFSVIVHRRRDKERVIVPDDAVEESVETRHANI